jgi:uncharacterized protein (TIGR03437 family)
MVATEQYRAPMPAYRFRQVRALADPGPLEYNKITMGRHRQRFRKMCRVFLGLAGMFMLSTTARGQGIITTAAGTDWVFNADGKPALSAPFGKVAYVTLDRLGNPVFSDPGGAVVVRLNADGTLTVLAGNGIQGYSGDGGLAVNAALNAPQGVAFDSNNNLYIADSGNERIRMVMRNGIITTVAGTGKPGYSGDGGPATAASLNYPIALAIDSANSIYVSEIFNNVIRKITPDGMISTFISPTARVPLSDVEDIAFDPAGNLYLAEFGSDVVRIVDAKGNVTTFAGDGQERFSGDGGPASKASLFSPGGVAADGAGNIYISDTNNFCIRKVNPQGIISTIAGNRAHGFSGDGGPALNASFRAVFGLTVDAGGNLFLADRDNYRIRKVNAAQTISTVAGNGGFRIFSNGIAAANAFLFQPFGISADASGNLYIADTENQRVRMIRLDGTISTIAGNGGAEYSGDRGPAINAGFDHPASVTPDRQGNLYIADSDNGVIRKITPDGNINTIAGNGGVGYNGDNRQATSASLDTPRQVVVDSAGNLYISDEGQSRIRQVAPNGIITTFAGNGKAGFGGDGGSPTSASLNGPIGLAFDQAGNLYVADYENERIRRISPDGKTISTIAGGGTRTLGPTDSFPATQALLSGPLGVVVDSLNNVYFSDVSDRVLKVSSSGLISVVAGNGTAGFSGDGGLSTQAALDLPWGLALDAGGNLLIADVYNNRIRSVLIAPPTLQVTPASLSFSAKSGGGLSDPQSVAIAGSVSGLLYTVAANISGGGAWLKVDQSAGAVPAALQVVVDPTGLAAGQYQGSIVITSGNTNPPSRTIPVTLTIAPPDNPKLSITTQALTFSMTQGAAPILQNLPVLNQGGGSLVFSGTTATDTGGNWLSLSPANGTATPVQPAVLTVQADPTGLNPGTYTGSVAIAGDIAGSLTIPVTMTVSPIPRKILLSQAGLKFTAVALGGAPLPQTFAVLNAGQGDLGWTVQADTVPSGGKWLTITPSGGTSTAGSPSIPLVGAAVDATGLDPGEYYGKVQIFAPDADNSPQTVTVILDVLPAGSNPGPDVQPTGLIFTGPAGSSPSSQNVFVSNLSNQTISYSSGRSTPNGQSWFLTAPTNGAVAPNQPGRIVVQPDFTSLAPGTYTGTLQLSFPGFNKSVNILAIVSGSSATSSAREPRPELAPRASCSPQQLNLQVAAPSQGFSYTLFQSVTVGVAIADNCGSPVVNGTVMASFSNGDPDLKLLSKGGGSWTGTWIPTKASSKTGSQINMSITAIESVGLGTFVGGQTQAPLISGTPVTVAPPNPTPATTTPAVNAAVVNSASFVPKPLVAPGGLISIFGQQLAERCDTVANPPLASQLGGTQVFLDNQALAISYACDTQINAQVPYDLSVNTSHQVLVQKSAALSVPIDLSVAATQPAIFTVNQQGTGQGDIFVTSADGTQSVLAGPADPTVPAAPAKAGDTVTIYCSGLGTVAPGVNVGAPAPPNPIAQTTSPVLVSIGNQPATVLSSILAPNNAGLYIVTALVPSGITPGSQVPVVLTTSGQSSPPVTMAVQ